MRTWSLTEELTLCWVLVHRCGHPPHWTTPRRLQGRQRVSHLRIVDRNRTAKTGSLLFPCDSGPWHRRIVAAASLSDWMRARTPQTLLFTSTRSSVGLRARVSHRVKEFRVHRDACHQTWQRVLSAGIYQLAPQSSQTSQSRVKCRSNPVSCPNPLAIRTFVR
jgi:hypothetical protein